MKEKELFFIELFDFLKEKNSFGVATVKRATVATPKKIWKNLRAYTTVRPVFL